MNLRILQAIKNAVEGANAKLGGTLSVDGVAGVVSQREAPPRPRPPRLMVDIDDVAASPRPHWMSKDGARTYGVLTNKVYRSDDDWGTTSEIFAVPDLAGDMFVNGVRELDNGEILISVRNDASENRPGELWLSDGYADDPGTATISKVLTCVEDGARIDGYWGLSSFNNVVVAAEYGTHGQARRVYMSVDSGETWEEIFTGPTDGGSGGFHVHGAAFDPYRGWIWMVTGDGTHRSTRVKRGLTDDADWETIDTTHQPVGVIALPECVLLTTDSAPNGVLRVDCAGDAVQDLSVEVAYRLDDAASLEVLGILPFQRDFGYPVLLPFAGVGATERAARLLATLDGYEFHELWTDHRVGASNGGMEVALGPTASDRLVGMLRNTGRTSFFTLLGAPWPEWK